jgi:hypothetical protein
MQARNQEADLRMYRLHVKGTLLRLAVSGLAALVPIAVVAQTAASCKALVEIKSELWFARADGTLVGQVTNDNQFRSAIALNPGGRVIAWSGKDAPDDVTLIDAGGRRIADVDLRASDAVTDLEWITPTLLRAAEHLGPRASRFHFIRLGAGNTASVVPAAATGSSCALSPSGKDVACIIGDAELELNGRSIYSAPDTLAAGTTVQTLDVAVGTGATAATSPAFRVDVKGILDGKTVQLRITTPDGLWTEQHVRPGNAMAVEFGDSDTAVRYAVVPATTTNSGVVRLSIVRRNPGDYAFEGGIAWDPAGKRVALVEANPAGQRTWILLQAATASAGAVDARELLPIDGPVRSISFTSDTHLRIKGATQVFEQEIPAQGKVAPGGAHAIASALPRQISVHLGGASVLAEVKGWSCQ